MPEKYKILTPDDVITPTEFEIMSSMDFDKILERLDTPNTNNFNSRTHSKWGWLFGGTGLTVLVILAYSYLQDSNSPEYIDINKGTQESVLRLDSISELEKPEVITDYSFLQDSNSTKNVDLSKGTQESVLSSGHVQELHKTEFDSTQNELSKEERSPDSAFEQAFPIVGFDSLFSFLQKNLVYPEHRIQDSISGKVNVGFEISLSGTVERITILKGIDKDFNSEAIRVITTMPAWKPAYQDGKPVSSTFSITLHFVHPNN